MDQCYFCKGRIIHKTITHMHTWQEKFFLFEDVPAEVCQQCGETYFRPDVLEAMDAIVTRDVEPKTQVVVPVFSISSPAP
jgi:YgiT-type zinc finger domain-containing protein